MVVGLRNNEFKIENIVRNDKRYTLIKKMSMDAVKEFAPKSIDIVFIDANHNYEYVLDDIREWSKIVRTGGIVSGHDYFRSKKDICPGVKRAVNEYVAENNIDVFLVPTWFGIFINYECRRNHSPE